MFRYEGLTCPVCKREFENGDDVVTCADCGTPHHRECYNMIGKCVNAGLHNTGYTFEEKPKAKDNEEKEAKIGEYYSPDSDKNEKNDTPATPINIGINSVEDIDKEYGKTNETIDGNDITEVAATIRTNIPRFIGIFRKMEKTGKKTSWNWGAMFFGGLYFLFRKMYKEGLAIVCTIVALLIGSDALMLKYAPKYVEAVKNAAMLYADGKKFEPDAIMTSDFKTAAAITYAMLGAVVIIHIICALVADYQYKKSISEIIKKVNDQLENDMSFSINPMMGASSSLSQEQMKKMYLARRGGVSLFAPTLAVFIFYTLLSFI